MKRLPRPRLHRIYNPIDNRPVNSAFNPWMLEKANETYEYFQSCSSYYSGYSARKHYDWSIVDDGLEYNNFRLGCPSADISYSDPGFDQYSSSDLYKLQNPDFKTDWEANHSIYPSGRQLLVKRILQNYLLYPTYNVGTFSGLNGSPIDFVHSAFDPSKDFFSTIPSADWAKIVESAYKSFKDSLEGQEGSSAISGKYDEDSYERKLVVDQIRSNPGDEVKMEKKETVVYSETLEEFEKEYQAFIEMLKAQKYQKT